MRRPDLSPLLRVWPSTALAQQSACKVWRVAYSTRASAARTKRSTPPQVMEKGEFLGHLKSQGRMR